MANTFDVIVVGLGGMGAAASGELARRGLRVLGLDQLSPGHDQGSSHGHTRIIRTAYFEHPDYVPLVRRAFTAWQDLQQQHNTLLLHPCDLLSIAQPDSSLLLGVLASAQQHQVPVESLSNAELRQRYPAFHFDEPYLGVIERAAGVLLVDDCVRLLHQTARTHGAQLHFSEPVLSWSASPQEVIVQTTQGEYRAASLVLTTGPWAARLLGPVAASLHLMRQVTFWFQHAAGPAFASEDFPIFIADIPEGHVYGLPALDARGVKIARHYGAPLLDDPDEVKREVGEEDEAPVRTFVQRHLPAMAGPASQSAVCIYTLTPDHHFLIDHHPDHANVAFAVGFSGHGFKFAPVVGEILADLIQHGQTTLPSSLFRWQRLTSS
jgi:sarcosine oxidase